MAVDGDSGVFPDYAREIISGFLLSCQQKSRLDQNSAQEKSGGNAVIRSAIRYVILASASVGSLLPVAGQAAGRVSELDPVEIIGITPLPGAEMDASDIA